MKQVDILNVTYKHMDSFYKELKQIYHDFDIYPKPAQYALFDLIFNLGKIKLKNGFPAFNRAVLFHAWPVAVKESNRKPPVASARKNT